MFKIYKTLVIESLRITGIQNHLWFLYAGYREPDITSRLYTIHACSVKYFHSVYIFALLLALEIYDINMFKFQ